MFEVKDQIESVRGFRAAGVHAGLKAAGERDMALILSDRPCTAAGVFTRNKVQAAPVIFDKQQLEDPARRMRAVAVNTKYANALTGPAGMTLVQDMARAVSETAAVSVDEVLILQTGVIGVLPPLDKITAGIEQAYDALGHGWQGAAEGILTTDTRVKIACVDVLTINGTYRIAGIAKGSGMIAPNMATMLATIVTDAGVDASLLRQALNGANQQSFNRIVVDGDTSTNDTVLLLANGASGVTVESGADLQQFQAALTQLCIKLAQDIVRDGEGATKFISLHVTGARSTEQAERIAHTIAASPLVKTAFFGNDANWGRIIAAAGRAGVPFEPDKARLSLSAGEAPPDPEEGETGVLIYDRGQAADYEEADATRAISGGSVYVALDLGVGDAEATVWTCDLSHDYVSINGDYRT